jgi:hypothetical protein
MGQVVVLFLLVGRVLALLARLSFVFLVLLVVVWVWFGMADQQSGIVVGLESRVVLFLEESWEVGLGVVSQTVIFFLVMLEVMGLAGRLFGLKEKEETGDLVVNFGHLEVDVVDSAARFVCLEVRLVDFVV